MAATTQFFLNRVATCRFGSSVCQLFLVLQHNSCAMFVVGFGLAMHPRMTVGRSFHWVGRGSSSFWVGPPDFMAMYGKPSFDIKLFR